MISETGMQQQFCLRWNNHKTNLLTVLGEQFRNEYFTDVTLACEGGSFIKCHKMVLAACSSYFQCLFSELQCRHPVVVLKDVRYAEIQAILEYMYKGEVSITQEEVEPLLKVAEALKVKGLVGENNYKGRSPPNEYNAISTSSAFGGPPAQPHQQSSQHLRRHSSANEQPVGTPRTSTPSPDDLSNSGGAGSSGNHGGGRDSSSTSSSVGSRENTSGSMVAVKMESQENASPPHSTGIHPSLQQRPPSCQYGRGASAPDKSASGPLSLPIWPMAGLPMNTPHTTQSIATSMFGYEAVFAAASNAEVMSPLRRKKLSSFYSSRDTPILRTVLGQGQADSSQPMSLVCHNDGQDQMPQSNGPMTPQDGSYSMEVSMNETMHSPSSSPQSFYSDSKGNVSSAIANYVPSQKPEWKRYKQYTRTDILSAIDAVRNGMSALQAARKYGVPSRTLYDKVKKLGISTQRPFKRSNGSNGAAFPYGISGTGGAMMFGLGGDEEGGVPGAILEQQGLLQHALELGNKMKLENVAADREAMSSTPPLPPTTPTLTAVNATVAASTFSTQNLLQRALEIEERMIKVEQLSMTQPGGDGTPSASPTAAPTTNDHRSPSPNQLIKYAQRGRSLTPSPQPQADEDDMDDVDDYEDQVEDLSMSRKPEQQSRVIMPPMNQATAAAMLATCSDSRRD